MTASNAMGPRVSSAAAVAHIHALIRQRPDANWADVARAAQISRSVVWAIMSDPPAQTVLHQSRERAILGLDPSDLRIPSSRAIPGAAARDLIADLMSRGWSRPRIAEAAGLNVNSIHDGQLDKVQVRTMAALMAARSKLSMNASPNRSGRAPRTPMLRRVEALVAQQWPRTWIADQVGANVATLYPRGNTDWAQSRLAVAVDHLFHAYRSRLGPSAMSRQSARAKGYAPWLLWSSAAIDDERATPDWALMDDLTWRESIRRRYSATGPMAPRRRAEQDGTRPR